MTRWALTLAAMMGNPLPPLPELPGRRIACCDQPASDDPANTLAEPSQEAKPRPRRPVLRLKPRNTAPEDTA